MQVQVAVSLIIAPPVETVLRTGRATYCISSLQQAEAQPTNVGGMWGWWRRRHPIRHCGLAEWTDQKCLAEKMLRRLTGQWVLTGKQEMLQSACKVQIERSKPNMPK